ncbi:MAG: triose-phosphate isomerase [Candidatus Binatia bacterium]
MPTRTPLIAGNWKMHGTQPEALRLIDELLPLVGEVSGRDVLVAPPFTALVPVADRLKGSRIALSGQNLHWEERGAFTGEVSGPMLVGAGCSHVIVGHSERRQLFGDSDLWVARKTAAALRSGLTPIVCVGETSDERDQGQTFQVVERQVRSGLEQLSPSGVGRVVLAYEPVWAIGTGKVATPSEAQEVHAYLRCLIGELAGPDIAGAIRIIYGGSVKPDNIDALMQQPDLDGALVGGASLHAADFARIVHFAA